jgi:Sulfotransferase domain
MTLPNFLGIGTARAGTTWLDTMLRNHPDVYLPTQRKEVHFFDQYYDRGLDWYKTFFPVAEQSSNYQKIGEITPRYLFDIHTPERIQMTLADVKLIVMLRNPADRAYSHYGFCVRELNEQRSFDQFVRQTTEVVEIGRYANQIERYFSCFDQENILILIYEEVMQDKEKALQEIADFLEIDADRFDRSILEMRINASRRTRFHQLRSITRNARNYLRDHDLDWLWNLAKRTGIESIFESSTPLPKMTASDRQALLSDYASDILKLESLLGRELPMWKNSH